MEKGLWEEGAGFRSKGTRLRRSPHVVSAVRTRENRHLRSLSFFSHSGQFKHCKAERRIGTSGSGQDGLNTFLTISPVKNS